jgi:hypothetical protein
MMDRSCCICKKEVVWSKGALVLKGDMRDIKAYQDKVKDWEETHNMEIGVSASELLLLPDRVPWIWGHQKCVDRFQFYWIDGERIDTPLKALHWTLHMMEKNWFESTRWDSVIDRLFDVWRQSP